MTESEQVMNDFIVALNRLAGLYGDVNRRNSYIVGYLTSMLMKSQDLDQEHIIKYIKYHTESLTIMFNDMNRED